MKIQATKSGRRARTRLAEMTAADAEACTVDRQVKIALAAYFIAEKRGFEPGHEVDDWFAAEVEIAQAEQSLAMKPTQRVQTEGVS